MPRGVAHPPELRAQAVAEVIAGASLSEVARQHGLDKALVSRWVAAVATVATDQRARALREPATLEDLLYDLVEQHTLTLRAQLQAAARAEWLEKQSAAELAGLLVAERDTLIRLLAGFRPASSAPELPDPATAAPRPATDGR